MTKNEFLAALRHALGKLPASEIDQSLAFYEEIIDDRMEEGMSEQEALEALGSVQSIAEHISAEIPVIPRTIAKANTGSRILNIVLLCIFAPLWVPFVFLLVILVLGIYLGIWQLIVGLWVIVGGLIMSAVLGVVFFIWCLAIGHPLTGLFLLGCGLALCGLGLFALFGIIAVSKGLAKATVSFSRWLYGLFKKRSGGTSKQRNEPPQGPHAPPPPYQPFETSYSSINEETTNTELSNATEEKSAGPAICHDSTNTSEMLYKDHEKGGVTQRLETKSDLGKSEGAQSDEHLA